MPSVCFMKPLQIDSSGQLINHPTPVSTFFPLPATSDSPRPPKRCWGSSTSLLYVSLALVVGWAFSHTEEESEGELAPPSVSEEV